MMSALRPTVFATVIALTLGRLAAAQTGMGIPTDAMGRYRSEEEKSVTAYARGAKARRGAERATDAQERRKLYLRAKEEFSKAGALHPNFDAYLALGEVYLALGEAASAEDACLCARRLKPGNETADRCIKSATALLDAKAKGGSVAASIPADTKPVPTPAATPPGVH
jgi:hypothetical protein